MAVETKKQEAPKPALAPEEMTFQQWLEAFTLQEAFDAGRHLGRKEALQTVLAQYLERKKPKRSKVKAEQPPEKSQVQE